MQSDLQVRIVSKGPSIFGALVIDPATGEDIKALQICRMSIDMSTDDVNRATLFCLLTEVDVVAEAQVLFESVFTKKKYRLQEIDADGQDVR